MSCDGWSPVHCPLAEPRLSHRPVQFSCPPPGFPLSWKQGQPLLSTNTCIAVRANTHTDILTLYSVVFICSKTDAFWDEGWSTWLLLSWLGQVGDARVRTHEDVAGVQGTFQETLLGLGYVDAA